MTPWSWRVECRRLCCSCAAPAESVIIPTKPCSPKTLPRRFAWASGSWNNWRHYVADLIVRGGTLVTTGGLQHADIAVEEGLISAVGPELGGAAAEIDARGL